MKQALNKTKNADEIRKNEAKRKRIAARITFSLNKTVSMRALKRENKKNKKQTAKKTKKINEKKINNEKKIPLYSGVRLGFY